MSRIKRTLAILSAFGVLAILMSGIALGAEEDTGATDWVFFGFGLAICLAILAIALIIAIIVAWWVHKDANQRGMNGTLWAIIVIVLALLFGIIGLIIGVVIYLLVRKPIQPPIPPPGMYPPPGYPPQQPPQQGY